MQCKCKNKLVINFIHKRNILWKTHSSVVDFINDNDNIKFYFFDNSLKNDINKIIEDWLKKYNIKTIKRHHNVGVDIKKYDDWLYDKKINVDNGGLMTDLNWDGIGLFPQKEIIDILNKI